jgi:hypothetical protein
MIAAPRARAARCPAFGCKGKNGAGMRDSSRINDGYPPTGILEIFSYNFLSKAYPAFLIHTAINHSLAILTRN